MQAHTYPFHIGYMQAHTYPFHIRSISVTCKLASEAARSFAGDGVEYSPFRGDRVEGLGFR